MNRAHEPIRQRVAKHAFGLAGRMTAVLLTILLLLYSGFIFHSLRLRSFIAGTAISRDDLMKVERSMNVSTAVLAIGFLVGAMLLAYLVRRFASPIGSAADMIRDIAEGDGDLTRRLDMASRDEFGELAESFNAFIERLQDMLRETADSALEVSSTSQELSAASLESGAISQQIAVTMQQVAQGSSDQSENANGCAAAVAQLAHAIETVAQGTEEQASHLQTAAGVTEETGRSLSDVLAILERVALVTASNTESAARGAESVRAVRENTSRIGASTGEVSACIGELNDLSKEIRSIVSVIADIASQTNLLALNAAIEAARAGEYGRGFAVVADEVRGLAERSSQETKTIGGLIQKIGQAIEKAVASMERGAKDVAAGQELARDAGDALTAIFQSASEAKDMVASLIVSSQELQESGVTSTQAMMQTVEIAERNASLVGEMAASSEEVKRLIDGVAATSQESAAAAEEVSASTEEMNRSIGQVSEAAQRLAAMADRLRGIVGRFKV